MVLPGIAGHHGTSVAESTRQPVVQGHKDLGIRSKFRSDYKLALVEDVCPA